MIDDLKQAPKGAENLVTMHEDLLTKRAVTEQLSRDLEDPGNLIRYIYTYGNNETLPVPGTGISINTISHEGGV